MKLRLLFLCAALFAAVLLPAQASLGGILDALFGGSSAKPSRPPLLAAGTVAPDFSALRADNTPVKLSEYKGKVVLVDF